MTIVRKTVKPSGGDYASLQDALTGELAIRADLVSRDEQLTIECYDLGVADARATVSSSFITDATRFIRITVPTSQRHNGRRCTSKYRIATTDAFQRTLLINANYVRIEGFQVSTAVSNAGQGLYVDVSGANDVRITDTLTYDCFGDGIVNESGTLTLNNVISMSNGGKGFILRTDHASNCNAVNNGGTGFEGVGFFTTSLTNCYAGGNTGDDYAQPNFATVNLTTCSSEDGTLSTPTAAFATGSGARFTDVTPGSEDLSVGVLSTLKDAGTDVSGDTYWIDPEGYVDITKAARSTPPTVGAFEYVSSVTMPTPSALVVATNGVVTFAVDSGGAAITAASGTLTGTATVGSSTTSVTFSGGTTSSESGTMGLSNSLIAGLTFGGTIVLTNSAGTSSTILSGTNNMTAGNITSAITFAALSTTSASLVFNSVGTNFNPFMSLITTQTLVNGTPGSLNALSSGDTVDFSLTIGATTVATANQFAFVPGTRTRVRLRQRLRARGIFW